MGAADLIAIDVGSHSLTACRLASARQGLRLTDLAVVTVPAGCLGEGRVADHARLVDAFRRVVTGSGLKGKQVALAASLPGQSVLRTITVPLMTDGELAEQISWEVEQYVPYAVEDAAYHFQVVARRPESGQMEVLLAVARKSALAPLVEAARGAALEPVDFAPPALCAATWFAVRAASGTHALLHVAADSTHLVAITDGVVRGWRSIERGDDWLTRELARRLGASREDAERLKLALSASPGADPRSGGERQQVALALARQFGEELAELVGPALDDLEATSRGLGPIFVVGGAAAAQLLCEAIGNRTRREAKVWDPTVGLSFDEPARKALRASQPHALAVVLGLAARRGASIPLVTPKKGFFARLLELSSDSD